MNLVLTSLLMSLLSSQWRRLAAEKVQARSRKLITFHQSVCWFRVFLFSFFTFYFLLPVVVRSAARRRRFGLWCHSEEPLWHHNVQTAASVAGSGRRQLGPRLCCLICIFLRFSYFSTFGFLFPKQVWVISSVLWGRLQRQPTFFLCRWEIGPTVHFVWLSL